MKSAEETSAHGRKVALYQNANLNLQLDDFSLSGELKTYGIEGF